MNSKTASFERDIRWLDRLAVWHDLHPPFWTMLFIGIGAICSVPIMLLARARLPASISEPFAISSVLALVAYFIVVVSRMAYNSVHPYASVRWLRTAEDLLGERQMAEVMRFVSPDRFRGYRIRREDVVWGVVIVRRRGEDLTDSAWKWNRYERLFG